MAGHVDGACWCEALEKNHLRRVAPHPEEQLLRATPCGSSGPVQRR
ncbi:DUF5926 family protein [Streptomyces iconiensis]